MPDKKRIDEIFKAGFPAPPPFDPLAPILTLGTAAEMLEVSVSFLRKIEAEGLMIYHRRGSGRRMLCREDIDRIKLIRNLNKAKGINYEGIRRLLALLPCWELKPCAEEERERCRILEDSSKPCWSNMETVCAERKYDCRRCAVYRFGAYCTEDMKALVHGGEHR